MLSALGAWRLAARAWRRLTLDAAAPALVAWTEYGRCCLQLRRFPEARAAVGRALELDPRHLLAWQLLGWLATEEGKRGEAARAWAEYSRCRLEAGELAAARDGLEQARQLQPTEPAAWRLLGQVAAQEGRWEEAAGAYREYSRCCLKRGQLARARAGLERALELQPDHPDGWQLLGKAAAKGKDWLAAARGWTEYSRRCLAYGQQARTQAGLAQALQCQPDSAEALDLMAQLARAAEAEADAAGKRGRTPASVAQLAAEAEGDAASEGGCTPASAAQLTAAEAGFEAAERWLEYGRACLHAGRLEEAAAGLRKAQRLAPENPLAWLLAGWTAAEAQDWPKARAAYRRALALPLAPQQEAETLVALAYAMKEPSEYAEGLALAERAAELCKAQGLSDQGRASDLARAWHLLKLEREAEAFAIVEGMGAGKPPLALALRHAYIKALWRQDTEGRSLQRLLACYDRGLLSGQTSHRDLQVVDMLAQGGRFADARRVYAHSFDAAAAGYRFPRLLHFAGSIFHGRERTQWFRRIRERALAMQEAAAREGGSEGGELAEGEASEAVPRRKGGFAELEDVVAWDDLGDDGPAALLEHAVLGANYGLGTYQSPSARGLSKSREFGAGKASDGGGATTVASTSSCVESPASALGPPTRQRLLRWRTPPQGGSYVRRRVFGIGLTRTGTTSLHAALQALGFHAAHFVNPYSRELIGERELARFDALTDTPIAWQFEALHERYPQAHFIYTVRPVAAWAASLVRHFRRWHGVRDYSDLRRQLRGKGEFAHGEPLRQIYRALYAGHATPEAAYEAHHQRVREFFAARPEARFLQLDIFAGDGWEELAGFLGLPVPATPFPHENQAMEGSRDA